MLALDAARISRYAALVVDDVVSFKSHAPEFAAADGQSGSCGRRRLDADFAVLAEVRVVEVGARLLCCWRFASLRHERHGRADQQCRGAHGYCSTPLQQLQRRNQTRFF